VRRFDHERRAVFEVAVVCAVLGGIVAAVLTIATSLGLTTIILVAAVTYIALVAAILLLFGT